MPTQKPDPTLDQLTMRDLIAMFALSGHIASGTVCLPAFRALFSYQLADAMIAAREVPHD